MRNMILTIYFGAFAFCNVSSAQQGEVKDADGNSYKTVKIGTQEWMAENLRTTKFCNGDPIEHVKSEEHWSSAASPAWCLQLNSEELGAQFGALYNWHAASDDRNVCPCGWKVPDDADWEILSEKLGGNAVAGGKMKVPGTMDDETGPWHGENEAGDNQSGFSGLPGGGRAADGDFQTSGFAGGWWSSTPAVEGTAWGRGLLSGSASVVRDRENVSSGYSIRCIRE